MSAELEAGAAPGVTPDLEAEAAAVLAELEPAAASGPESDEPPASEETAALCASLLEVTFNQLIAPKHGAHWKLERSECDALGKAYGAVLDKYFPNLRTGPEAAAILLSVAVLGPRIAQSAQLRAQEQEAKPDGSSEQRASIRRPPPVPVAGGEFRTGGASE